MRLSMLRPGYSSAEIIRMKSLLDFLSGSSMPTNAMLMRLLSRCSWAFSVLPANWYVAESPRSHSGGLPNSQMLWTFLIFL